MTNRAREVADFEAWRHKQSLRHQRRWQHYRKLRQGLLWLIALSWILVGLLGVIWVRGR